MPKIYRLAGFIPFLLIVFLNTFVDLGHKIVIQNTIFKVYDGQLQIILTAVVNGLILLPFVMLFTPAGFLTDKFPKPGIMRASAAVAVGLTLLVTLSYYQGRYEIAFGLTFLLAVQSAIYSPAKYGYIKEMVGTQRLAEANAMVQAVTIVAMLGGVFFFSLLFEHYLVGVAFQAQDDILQAVAPVGWLLVVCSTAELALTYRLGKGAHENRALTFDWQRYGSGRYLRQNFGVVRANRVIWLSIVGLSVFWGVSQVVLASFPAFAKETLAETNTTVIQGLLACSGFGIIIGSLMADRASRDFIETGLIPLGTLGMVGALALLPGLESRFWLGADILAFGLFGGLFIVPLNSLIQFHAGEDRLGTVLAGNNWVQNITMLGFLCLTVGFALGGVDSFGLFHLVTLVALVGAIYTVIQLPQSFMRYLVALLFASRYRMEILGFKNIPEQGGVLMLGNHISWLDWAMIQIACPRPMRFVMHRGIYQRRYLKWILDLAGVIPISGGQSKAALEEVNVLLRQGEVVCIFPEGSISRSGQLGEFRKGFERTVDGVILPFYLRGLWGSRFSRSSERLQTLRRGGMKRDVIIAFGKPMPMDATAHQVKQQVFDLSIEAWDQHTATLDSLPLAILRGAKRSGQGICLADSKGKPLSGYKTLAGMLAFSRLIGKLSPEPNIVLLLPTTSAGLITNSAALLQGRTVVNLNYTANLKALEGAVEHAGICSIYTSRRFISKLEKKGVDLAPLLEGVQAVYLEDLKEKVSRAAGLFCLFCSTVLPASWLYALFGKPVSIDDPAAIMFSSGSEGTPKGVVLTNRNIMGNIRQISDVLNVQDDDRVMATLPLFHAFGLTVTGFMPLVEGMPAICHPDPTDALNIAKAISGYQAAVFCGTSTFLRLFVRNKRVHPLMLDSIRLVVAGAERLNLEVADAFQLKFHKPIYEGYGATETSPVASVNIPDRIDPSDWGDKGHIDADGFLTIVDRYSRFAKIGGEMISLGAVEGGIGEGLPEAVEILATTLADDKKGEQVVLLFAGDMTREEMQKHIRNCKLNPLMQPSELLKVDVIPKLGSGKNDYNSARQLAAEMMGEKG
ncbi:MFS transporter [Solemya velesiana gill symbiont]|uniref:Acyl-[ACP]--phospholipid O-acyltransferase n=1 Tax=Solemya velesiana gill symbiont TaxID=1918948 RepID=A0A1T2KWC5_9GAMM|nr:MFS transporter [Solemya velesiana gill symbiont]OOZ37157.1 acyl-[ACP]--phospholipid O-acyltransferase [Solemya velesiana gill symbiont]